MPDILNIIADNEVQLEQMPETPAPLPEVVEIENNKAQLKERAVEPVVYVGVNQDPWMSAKVDYLADTTVKVQDLAKKHGLEPIMLAKRIKDEKWEQQRSNLFARADAKMQHMMENTQAEIKARHALMGIMLQNIAKKSIKKYKKELDPKDALQFIVEGVKMEREAHGIGKDQPKIVNIITQQQAIIDKYRVKNG